MTRPGGGFGTPTPQDNRPPEEVYEVQLRQLNEMGFHEFERNVAALRRSGGNVQGAVEYLSQHPTEARYTDSAATAVLEGSLRCRVVGKNSDTATTDMPTSVGGGGSAPSPGWLFSDSD